MAVSTIDVSDMANADRERLGLVIFHPYAHLGGCCDDPIVLSMFR